MTKVHMICGYLGAGKTTFARGIERRDQALRFSADEVYLRLFSKGPTYELDQEAMGRVLDVIFDQWVRAVSLGVSVVLDLGFWHRELREKTRERASVLGAEPLLYWVRCDDARALGRCLARNGQDGAFLISAEGYRDLKPHFEAPTADEGPLWVDSENEGNAEPAPVENGVSFATYVHERDCEQVVALWSEVFTEEPSHNDPRTMIDRMRKHSTDLFFVASQGGAVVGTVVGGYDGVRGWMYHLATLPSYRGRGIARGLILQLEHRLTELGCVKLNLQVRKSNATLVHFYQRLGYSEEARASLGKRL